MTTLGASRCSLDPDLLLLNGGLLQGDTAGSAIEAFDLEGDNPPGLVAGRIDSVAPMSLSSVAPYRGSVPPSAPARVRSSRAALAIAAGTLLGVLAGAAIPRGTPDHAPVAAAAPNVEAPSVEAPVELVVPAPVLVARAPTVTAAAVPVAPKAAPAAVKPIANVTTASTVALAPRASATPEAPAAKVEVGPFDRASAALAVKGVGPSASACSEGVEGTMVVPVTVTFASSGQAIAATAGGPLTGTAHGGCVARALRGARVAAFEGEAVTVSTSIRLR